MMQFLDKRENKGFRKIKNSRVRLLLDFFFRTVKKNKFLFLLTGFVGVAISIINYNSSVIVRDFFSPPREEVLQDDSIDDGKGKQIKFESTRQSHDIKRDDEIIADKSFYFWIRTLPRAWRMHLKWERFIYALIIYLIFAKSSLSIFHWYLNNYASDKIEKDLKFELFKVLTNAKYSNSSEISGKILTQFTSDLDSISKEIWMIPSRLVYVITSIFLIIHFDFNSNGKLQFDFLFTCFSLFAFLTILVLVLLRKAIQLGIAAKKRYEEDNRFIFERVRNLEYIKNNSSETFEQSKVLNRLNETFRRNKKSLLWTTMFKSVPNYLIIPIIPYLFLLIVTKMKSIPEMRLDPRFIFSNFVVYYHSLQKLNSEIGKILDAILGLEDLSSELLIVTESVLSLTDDNINAEDEVFSPGDILLDNVSFAYPSRPDNVIIENLTFKFEYGKKYGVAGKNGIGKSTITKILLKLYDISAGKVLIGDKDLSRINTTDLHNNICHLTNRPSFFNMSIAENAFYPFVYDEKRDLQRLVRAAKNVKIMNFITSLPHGFNTILREGGTDLSEGQKQQLEAMKVFLRKYEIYIFDEILSNVHPITRKSILSKIFEEVNGKTVITIDHHYDIFSHMDYVYTFSSKKFSKVRKLKKLEEESKEE